MKKHYSLEEKIDIIRFVIRKETYEEPDAVYSGSYDCETMQIAKAIDTMAFETLKRLAKAIRIISQGVKS